MTDAPELIIIGGPNGAGKSTFANEFLKERPMPFLSADSIASELSPDNPAAARIAAGRRLIEEVARYLEQSKSFSIETTLAGRTARSLMGRAGAAGYAIHLVFLYVDSVDTCLARVQERVRKGGHDVPARDVGRRFHRSLGNFWRDYRFRVNQWFLCYNAAGTFHEIASGSGDSILTRDPIQFQKFVQLIET